MSFDKPEGTRKHFYWDKELKRVVEGSPNSRPKLDLHFIQTDEIPPTISHATEEGKVFTSRAKLEQHYREHGFRCTGGEHLKEQKIPGQVRYKPDSDAIREATAKSLNDLRWGNVPLSEKEKELCRREERNYQNWKNRNGYK